MTDRRTFLSYAAGMLAAVLPATAQKAATQNGKAIVCDDSVLTCPNGHKTCRSIDAILVIGSDRNLDNPEYSELRGFHIERCETCLVAFFRE